MDNVGHIRTHQVTIVELATKKETGLAVQSGEDLSTGDFIIWCTLNDQEISSSRDSYFLSFQKFRDKLLEAGYGMKCNGARLNAVSYSKTGNSTKVYLVESGDRSYTKQEVDIWDKADISDFPDTKHQNRTLDQMKAIDDRKASNLPPAAKILILVPLLANIVWIVAYNFEFENNLIVFLCSVGFSLTVGMLMLVIGTVIAGKRKSTPFLVAGLIGIFITLLPIMFLVFNLPGLTV